MIENLLEEMNIEGTLVSKSGNIAFLITCIIFHLIYTLSKKSSCTLLKDQFFPKMFHIRALTGSRWMSSTFWYQTCKIWLINNSSNLLNGDRYVLKSCKCYHSSIHRSAHLSLALYSCNFWKLLSLGLGKSRPVNQRHVKFEIMQIAPPK